MTIINESNDIGILYMIKSADMDVFYRTKEFPNTYIANFSNYETIECSTVTFLLYYWREHYKLR